jgi:predicted ATPase/DNA-binding XRE family transcriptional regulator
MSERKSSFAPQQFSTLGELLRYLRERAHLTQRELAAQIGYHHTYISYVEKNQRVPAKSALLGRFVPVFGLEEEPQIVELLLQLEKAANKKSLLPESQVINQPAPKGNRTPPSHNLTPILGREGEIRKLGELLRNPLHRLITVIGPPGVGKTRLVQHCANLFQGLFLDGVLFIDLTPITRPELILPAISTAIGLKKYSLEDLIAALQHKNTLFILDNFEQVVAAAPDLIPLLAQANDIKIMTTSREALRIRGEQVFPLEPFTVEKIPSMDSPAVKLFIERAQAAEAHFQIQGSDASLITEICRRLDGLPLAIELAAARTPMMSLPAMLDQLDHHRFEWLTNGARDLPSWKQTLWGTIEWGYNLLDDKEKILLNRLSVFAGGWTQKAARAICSDDQDCKPEEIYDLLGRLASKSMIVSKPEIQRFDVLESIHEFANAKLKESGGEESIREAHYKYFLEFSREGHPRIHTEADQLTWLQRVEHDINNIRAALAWAIQQEEQPNLAMELGYLMQVYWVSKSHFIEAQRSLQQILALDPTPSFLRASLLRAASDFINDLGDYAKAQQFEEEAMKISESLGDVDGIYLSMEGIAVMAGRQGNYAKTAELLEQVLEYRREIQDKIKISSVLNNLAIASKRLGNLNRAKELFTEKIALAKEVGDQQSLGHALNGISEVLMELQEYDSSLKFQKESIYIRDKIGDRKGLSNSLHALALTLYCMKSFEQATLFKSAYTKIREELGIVLPPTRHVEDEEFNANLLAELGRENFDAIWSKGQALSQNEIVKLALITSDRSI